MKTIETALQESEAGSPVDTVDERSHPTDGSGNPAFDGGRARNGSGHSITDPNHPALAVTPAVALIENALELLRPHMCTKGGDASANPSTIRGSNHNTDVAEGEGEQREPSERCQEADGNTKLKSQNSANGSAPSPLPQPDVQTACSPEAINEVLEADFPEDAIEEELMQQPEYWFCIVGPADRATLVDGADYPMRRAVQHAFNELTGHDYENQWSGWGNDEKKRDSLLKTWNKSKDQAFCEVVAQTVTEENVALRSQIKQIREDIKKADTMACSTIEKLLCNRLLNRVDRITGQLAHDHCQDSHAPADVAKPAD